MDWEGRGFGLDRVVGWDLRNVERRYWGCYDEGRMSRLKVVYRAFCTQQGIWHIIHVLVVCVG